MFYAAPFLNFYIAVHLLTLTLVGLFQLLVSENYISSQVRGDGKVAFYTFLHLIHDDVDPRYSGELQQKAGPGGKVLSSAEAATHLSVLLGNGLEAGEAMF